LSNVQIIHGDCMTAMASMKDKEFELAIVDPPYGIGIVEAIKKSTKKGTSSMFKMTKGGNGADFDKAIPSGEYFSELFRISNNQIIWGGNYFLDYLGSTNGFVVWDKMNGTNPMADAELAWTSFKGASRMFRMHHFSTGYGVKIHPTQKPIALYQWLIKNYAKPGDKILDTHLGSGSSAIAADIMGYDFTGYEIDEDYYKAALDRFNRHKQQCVLEFA
jgi:site-specific DNA-methyltransferase (adenine-specific)